MSTEETYEEWIARHPPSRRFLKWTLRRYKREHRAWSKIARELRLGSCWSLRWNSKTKRAEEE